MAPQHIHKPMSVGELIIRENLEVVSFIKTPHAIIRSVWEESGRTADHYEWTCPNPVWDSTKIGLTRITDEGSWTLIKIDSYRATVETQTEILAQIELTRSLWNDLLQGSWNRGHWITWKTKNSVDGSNDYHCQKNPTPELLHVEEKEVTI